MEDEAGPGEAWGRLPPLAGEVDQDGQREYDRQATRRATEPESWKILNFRKSDYIIFFLYMFRG